MKIVYETQATATGGRVGAAKTNDGRLSVNLSTPTEMGGDGGAGTNPEQLFAAGYSACFLGAMKAVSGKLKITVPEDASVTGHVGFGPNDKGAGYAIDVTLEINLPGLGDDQAQTLVNAAHEVCPYSNATRGNVDVKLKLT